MTTLAAISTKDALVMGCDSLASVTMYMVDPFSLMQYFDPANNYEMKLDVNGKPLLKDFHTIFNSAEDIPYNHMTHVDKMFSLEPLEMGVMTTGIASIGDYTIKNLINQFKFADGALKTKKRPANYTVRSIATRLLEFVRRYYEAEYSTSGRKPYLEFMVGGYDKRRHIPTILKIYVHEDKIEDTINTFGIVFGGQMIEIQRLVFGTDQYADAKIVARSRELFNNYHNNISGILANSGSNITIPALTSSDYDPFQNNWRLDGIEANWGDFSERNAIECIKFFIEVMIKSQQFSNKLPTVGGDVHLATITKTEGFKLLQ